MANATLQTSDGLENQVLKQYFKHWQAERNSAVLYAALAGTEKNPKQAKIYKTLALTEKRHADYWAEKLKQAGVKLPRFVPFWRTDILIWLAKHVDPALVLPHIAAREQLEADGYLQGLEHGQFLKDEQANADLLNHLGHHEFTEFIKKVILKIRRPLLIVVAATLFLVSVLLARNVQLEGLFFGLLGGIFIGPVMHYLLGKVLIPLPFGRVWCGWACWTAAVLDQLPYRKSAGWLPKHYRRLRYVHFFLSMIVVLLLFFVFGYQQGALGPGAVLWFLIGNALYWLVGIVLAIALKDNRAFCKYVCPVSLPLKLTTRLALFKVSGDAEACIDCKSQACTTLCPMDINIPDYIKAGKRVLSTECIMCQQCVAVCPPNTLELSLGFDRGGEDLLEERQRVGA